MMHAAPRHHVIVLAALSAVGFGLPAFLWLVPRWVDGQYLAGVVALGGLLVLGWSRRRALLSSAAVQEGRRGSVFLLGVAVVCGAGLVAWAANVIESSVLLGWAFLAALTGLVLQASPRRPSLRLLPMAAYAMLIFPLPGVVSRAVSLPIRVVAAKGAAWILNGVGVECVATGVVIETLQFRNTVVPACGGEEVVHLFLVLGLALAYVQQSGRFGFRFWLQAVLIVPATLAANAVRIAVLTFVGHRWGEAAAAGFFHDFSGLLVFAVFLIAMIAGGELLSRLGRRGRGVAVAGGAEAAGEEVQTARPPLSTRLVYAAGAVEAVLILTALVYGGWSYGRSQAGGWGRELAVMVPQELRGWSWQNVLLTISEESYLSRNYVIKRVYRRGPAEVVLFVTTGAEGRRQAYHSPEVCYRAEGWEIVESRTGRASAAPSGEGRDLVYSLLRAKRGTTLATTIFWLDDGTTRSGTLSVDSPAEILRRLRNPFERHDRWALFALTSLDPDPARALAECLELAHSLP